MWWDKDKKKKGKEASRLRLSMPCHAVHPTLFAYVRDGRRYSLLACCCTRFMINNEGRSPGDSTLSLFLSLVMGLEYVLDERLHASEWLEIGCAVPSFLRQVAISVRQVHLVIVPRREESDSSWFVICSLPWKHKTA